MRKRLFSLLIILIISPLLFLSHCMITNDVEGKDIPYDIRGDWILNLVDGPFSYKINCTFTGTKEKGTVIPENGKTTTYQVGGDKGLDVNFYLWLPAEIGDDYFDHLRGTFLNENYIMGTGDWTAWSAERNESGAILVPGKM